MLPSPEDYRSADSLARIEKELVRIRNLLVVLVALIFVAFTLPTLLRLLIIPGLLLLVLYVGAVILEKRVERRVRKKRGGQDVNR